MQKIITTSGFYNPIHEGHLNLFKEAKEFGDYLIVIVNNDLQVKLKGSTPFMNEQERLKIISAIKYVDFVFLSIDKDKTVRETIKKVINIIKKRETTEDDCGNKLYYSYSDMAINSKISLFENPKIIFAKGGDSTWDNTPEKELLPTIFGVGGEKIQSSSWLKDKIKNE